MEKRQKSVFGYFNLESHVNLDKQEIYIKQEDKRKRKPTAFLDQSKKHTTGHLTQEAPTSSVGEAVVAGAMRAIGNMSKSGSGVSRGEHAGNSPKISPESLLGLSHERILSVVETFKLAAHTIGKKCLTSPVSKKSFLFKEFCIKCEEFKDGYNKSYESLKDQSSSDIEKIKKFIRYPQVVSSLCKFTLNYMKEAQVAINYEDEYNKFIEKVDLNILDSEQKQNTLKVYQAMFTQCCDKKLKEFNAVIDEGAHNAKNLFDVERKVNHVQRDIVALGTIIRQDYFQPHTNLPLLTKIDTQIGAYKEAMVVCDANRTEEHLRAMIKAVENISESYSQLAELRMKGKEHAVDSPVRYQREESDSEAEDRYKQIKADEALAKRLQEEEKLQAGGHSGSAIDIDSPRNRGLESEKRARSVDSVFARESDRANHLSNEKAITVTELQRKEVDLEHIEAIYKSGMQDIAQRKLKLYLHYPDSLSLEEVCSVGRELSRQLMDFHTMHSQLVGGSNKPKFRNIKEIYHDPENRLASHEVGTPASEHGSVMVSSTGRTEPGSLYPVGGWSQNDVVHKRESSSDPNQEISKIEKIYNYFEKSNQINRIEDEKIEKLFIAIKDNQNSIYEKFKSGFNQSQYKNTFIQFGKQINRKEEYSKEKNFEAYKSNILAEELGHQFLISSKILADLNHATFAVAYMQNPDTKQIGVFVSANDSIKSKYLKKVFKEFRGKIVNSTCFDPPPRHIYRKRHAEQVLLDHAKQKGYTIVGIGASRPFCKECCDLLAYQVEQQALGQNLNGRPVKKRSSSKEVQKSSQGARIESSGDTVRRLSQAGHSESSRDVTRGPSDSRTKETKLTVEERNKLENALSKHNRDWLGPLGKNRRIYCRHPKHIYTFKAPSGELYGTASLIYLVRNCHFQNGNSIHTRNLRSVWNLREKQSKGWKRAIPEEGQKVKWYIPTMYALRKENEDSISIVYSQEELQAYVGKQIANDINTGDVINGWKIIKCKKLKRQEETICQIINLKEGQPQARPSYQGLVDSQTPGLYLINRKKHKRAYWPSSEKEMNKAFCELAEIHTTDNYKYRSRIRMSLIKGQEVNGWEKEYYIELPKVTIQSPRGSEYVLDPCGSEKSYNKLVTHLPEVRQVPRSSEQTIAHRAFRDLLKGEKKKVKEWRYLSQPPEVKESPYDKGLIWEGIDSI